MVPVKASGFSFYWHALEWLLNSPPLAVPQTADQHWPESLQAFWPDHAAHLQALKNQPETLLAWMNQQKDRRLGRIFEHLLAFWLRQQPHLQVLAENLPVREHGRTLGALDFLLRDLRDGKLWHWEVACKFYLQAPLAAGGWQWLGPGRKDTLEKKLRHMQQHQLQLSHHPQIRQWLARQGHAGAIHRLGFVWGRLFYAPEPPAGHEHLPLHPQHPRGLWFRQPAPPGWQACHKIDLLSPQTPPASLAETGKHRPQPLFQPSVDGQGQWAYAVPADW